MALSGGLTSTAEAVCRAVAAIEPGPLVVALSGGPDSAVAAWACQQARPDVRAVHIDHGWEASADLRQAAQSVADQLDLPLEVIPVSIADGPSPEGIAREARLGALEATAGEALIVTGHHADDTVETVLGNLLRGAGVTGLAGIPARRDRFRRPLLPFRRAELRRLAEALELPFVDDPANEDISLRRNLIRHRVIPQLDQYIEGDLVELLGRTARHLAAADAYLDAVTPNLAVREDEGALLLPAAPLLTAPRVLAARAVRGVLRMVHPPYPGNRREVTAVFSVAQRQSLQVDLSLGWVAESEGPYVALHKPAEVTPPDPAELGVPGELTFGAHVITARQAEDANKRHLSTDRIRIAAVGGVTVRSVQPGDRIDLEGGSKSVADAFGEAAIPRRKRSAWPLVTSRGRIAWIAGVRVAPWARIETSRGAWVELERHSK